MNIVWSVLNVWKWIWLFNRRPICFPEAFTDFSMSETRSPSTHFMLSALWDLKYSSCILFPGINISLFPTCVGTKHRLLECNVQWCGGSFNKEVLVTTFLKAANFTLGLSWIDIQYEEGKKSKSWTNHFQRLLIYKPQHNWPSNTFKWHHYSWSALGFGLRKKSRNIHFRTVIARHSLLYKIPHMWTMLIQHGSVPLLTIQLVEILSRSIDCRYWKHHQSFILQKDISI